MNALTLSFTGSATSALRIDIGGVSTLVIGKQAINEQPANADTKAARAKVDVPGGFIIADRGNGLEWSHDLGEMTYAEAEAAVEKLNKESSSSAGTWRIPVLHEQESIRDITRYKPACDPIFTDMKSTYYLTASPDPSDPDCVFVVNFNHGLVYLTSRYNRCRVRAVRSVSSASQ